MKAIRFHRYGDAAVMQLDEVPLPEPGAGEVRVRIRLAGVNPVDWKLREGWFRDGLALHLPVSCGCDLAGVIEALGPDAGHWRVGDPVMAMLAAGGAGTYADAAVAPAHALASIPPDLDFATAAALPMGALTASLCLRALGRPLEGRRIVVHGAAGNVGSLAVQIARASGAWVAGVSRTDGVAAVRALGADAAIDYADPWSGLALEADLVVDTLGDAFATASLGLLKPGGHLVSTLGIGNDLRAAAEARGIACSAVGAQPDGAELERLARWAAEGRLRPTIGHRFPLAEAAAALTLVQMGRASGKVVLEVSP